MKKLVPLFFALLLLPGAMSFAQSFQDDFEGYPADAYVGLTSPDWRTWSAAGEGTTEDARVSQEQAFSGLQSMKLFSTSTSGGPMDIVLPFGEAYTDGTLTYGMKMFVVGGTGAYFNFQANQTIGQVWAADFYFRQTGTLDMTTGSTNQGSASFPHDEWFDVKAVLDLTNNDWQIFINEEKVAGFSNVNNRVAAINLFPVNPSGISTFYVDDVYFNYEPFIQPDLDVSLFALTTKTKNIAGNSQAFRVTLRNLGLETIESALVTWTDGTDAYTDTLESLGLLSGQDYIFTHSASLVTKEGTSSYSVTIHQINGGDDQNPNNDTRNISVTGVVPAPHKRVIAEEGTGTWCGWCPRGTILMDFLKHDYGDYFVPVAVHNNDPMAVTNYNAGVTSFPGFTGFPGVIMERIQVIDPLGLEDGLYNHIGIAPGATLLNGAEYDAVNGQLRISVTAETLLELLGNWRINVILTEDGVTGSGSGYNQANYYSGGAQGPMGGYESLPNPVPASMMVYDHVARAILGGFAGQSGSVPTPLEPGNTFIREFTWNVPANVNVENLNIISTITMPNGRVSNANRFTFQEAIANGLASSNQEPVALQSLDIYPNPASDQTTVNLHFTEPNEVMLEVADMMGRVVFRREFGVLSGEHWLQLPTYLLDNGIYVLRVHTGEGFASRRLTVQH